jgi:hypothetical protein
VAKKPAKKRKRPKKKLWGRNSPTHPQRLRTSERRLYAFELRKQGYTFEQIGQVLGIARQNAHRLVMGALKNFNLDAMEDFRRLQMARLDALLRPHFKRATDKNKPDAFAAYLVRAIMQDQNKLYGVNGKGWDKLEDEDATKKMREFLKAVEAEGGPPPADSDSENAGELSTEDSKPQEGEAKDGPSE